LRLIARGMRAVCGPLRRLRAGPEADLVCYIAAPLAASWQSALCTCGFWPKPPCRRCAMSGPRPVWAHLPRRARLCACRKSINLPAVILREKNGPSSTTSRRRRSWRSCRRVRGPAATNAVPRRCRQAAPPAAGAIRRSRSSGSPGGYVACPGAGTAGQAPVHLLLIWGRFRLGESFSWSRGGHGSRHVVPAGQGCCGVTSPVS
jgi:hypothetical protein